MSFREPRRRKSIHENLPLEELLDNVKNDAVLTRSRSKTKRVPLTADNEEVSVSESNRGLNQTFKTYTSRTFRTYTSSSPQNFATNKNRTDKPSSRNQSPVLNNKESYNFNANDISDDEENTEDSFRNRSNEFSSDNKIRQRLNSSGSKFQHNTSSKQIPQYEPESIRKQYINATSESTSNGIGIVYCLLIAVICSLILYFMVNRTSSANIGTQTEATDTNSKSEVLNDVLVTIDNMKSKYKNQNRDLWLDAYLSIASLIKQENKKPSIIVLLGNKSNPLECLARLLGNVSSKALRSDRLVLTPKEFEADVGSVIQTMRAHLKDNKAIIVSDLLNINVEALKAFHNLCDRINPLVEEAIYIITVVADDYDDTTTPLQYIESQLYKKLSGKMKQDAIQPLITRLTDGPILTVKPEPTVTDCSL